MFQFPPGFPLEDITLAGPQWETPVLSVLSSMIISIAYLRRDFCDNNTRYGSKLTILPQKHRQKRFLECSRISRILCHALFDMVTKM